MSDLPGPSVASYSLEPCPHHAPLPQHPVSVWQFGTIPSVHIFHGALMDVERLRRALEDALKLWPAVAGRFVRTPAINGSEAKVVDEDAEWDYFIAHSDQPLQLQVTTADSTASSRSPPHIFPSNAVVQPALGPYVIQLDVTNQLNNPNAPLLSVHLTLLPHSRASVLAFCWSHVLGDGAAFNAFSKTLSDLYAGEISIAGAAMQGHFKAKSLSRPSMAKWENHLLDSHPLPEAYAAYTKALSKTEVVQITFSREEMALLTALAAGPDEDGWVSEQDALSSYFVNLLRLIGIPVDRVTNSVNYRNHHPSHPSFPPTLKTLCANVAQMLITPLPPSSPNKYSLRPVARAIRTSLEEMRSDPEKALEWLSYSAFKVKESCDKQQMQIFCPVEGEAVVNSNWRYDWNLPFGYPEGSTTFHTSTSLPHFLRVFQSNHAERGAECTFRVKMGLADRALEEISRDRSSLWARWR